MPLRRAVVKLSKKNGRRKAGRLSSDGAKYQNV